MKPDVALVDCGGSNINSVRFAFERLGIQPRFTRDWEVIRHSTHVVLPGVGAAGAAMQCLHQSGLAERLGQLAQPVLGICLGMQLLFETSAEDETVCLGVIPARVTALPASDGLSIPHTGWNLNGWNRSLSHDLSQHVPGDFYGYFVHSYAAPPGPWTLATTHHGEAFSSIVAWRNFLGIQFHPERSGDAGQKLLAGFLTLQSAGATS